MDLTLIPRTARWVAIEHTYKDALAAEQALPGVPLQDVFMVTVHPADRVSPVAKRVFCHRTAHMATVDELGKEFGTGFFVAVQPSCKPYSPRLGEPSYAKWKAAMGASSLALADAQESSRKVKR